MTQFTSRYPALTVREGGRYLKFAGGKLTASGADVMAVIAFARDHPQYGIARVPETRSAGTVAELRVALEAIGESTEGRKADLQERLRAAYGEPT